VTEGDRETRARVLRVATDLFAARGFKKVTIREICREARANVAAVNYHFGDKVGLYREVLGRAIETMRETTEKAREAGHGGSPEDRLRTYVGVFLQRVAGAGQDSWIHRLMAREMADPTPALDEVTEQVIRPRLVYLGGIVSELLQCPAEDEIVLRCVLSIQAQCHVALSNPVSKRLLPDLHASPEQLDRLADHIVEFSLGGIRALRRDPSVPPAR
jgi:AcrR family transcriptional regulator